MTPAAAGRRWDVIRIGLSGLYLLGAITHLALGTVSPGVYTVFAEQALVPAYAEFWRSTIVPHLAILQPGIVVFELGVAFALLWRGRTVRIGHGAGAVFQAALVPSGPWGPINLVLVLVHWGALRRSYPITVLTFARRAMQRFG